MFNTKMKYNLILIFFFPILLSAEDKPKDPIKWSAYQGKKTWQEAKEHCQSLKMRLPTMNDLKLAKESGTTVGWRKYGTRYWSVNKNLGSNSLTYKAVNTLASDKMEEIQSAESQLGVYCANVTEESVKEDAIRQKQEELNSLFSTYQGKMEWDEANKKCKSIKMRLPTRDELKEAYESGITESWKKDGSYYWSSTPYDAERYFVLGVRDSFIYNLGRRSDSSYVRCRR